MSRHAATYTCDLCGSENAARNALARAEAEVLAERKRGDEYLAKWGDALKAVARLTDEARARELVLKDSVATWRNAHELLEAEVARLKGYVRMALDELGVPTDMYPANVTNAVEFLSECFKADLAARADAIIPLNDEQAEAFKALSESIKSEQRLEAELRDEPKGEVFWTHGWRKRAEKAEAELESIKKRSGDWTVTERKLEVERSLRRKMAERLKRYEDGLGAKDHFLIRAQQAEAQLDALLEANANNGLELMDEVGKRKLAEAELAKAPTWATVEALQEQLKASEAKFQRCLKSENAARSALARSEAEVARLNKLDTTYHHD